MLVSGVHRGSALHHRCSRPEHPDVHPVSRHLVSAELGSPGCCPLCAQRVPPAPPEGNGPADVGCWGAWGVRWALISPMGDRAVAGPPAEDWHGQGSLSGWGRQGRSKCIPAPRNCPPVRELWPRAASSGAPDWPSSAAPCAGAPRGRMLGGTCWDGTGVHGRGGLQWGAVRGELGGQDGGPVGVSAGANARQGGRRCAHIHAKICGGVGQNGEIKALE